MPTSPRGSAGACALVADAGETRVHSTSSCLAGPRERQNRADGALEGRGAVVLQLTRRLAGNRRAHGWCVQRGNHLGEIEGVGRHAGGANGDDLPHRGRRPKYVDLTLNEVRSRDGLQKAL